MVKIVILVISVIGLLVIILLNRDGGDRPRSNERQMPNQASSYSEDLITEQHQQEESGRQFTLSELRSAPEGEYVWDDTGCVFEVNNDGSVTVVGYFDPMELNVAPNQSLYDQLEADGLFDMLPRLWMFVPYYQDPVPVHGEPVSDIRTIIQIRHGYVCLMPMNEPEFILALGARSCLERYFTERFSVEVSDPASMGVLGCILYTYKTAFTTKSSFAYRMDNDYLCATMSCSRLGDTGLISYDAVIDRIENQSVIQPLEDNKAMEYISSGIKFRAHYFCRIIPSLILYFHPRLIYPITFFVKNRESGQVIKNSLVIPPQAELPFESTEEFSTLLPNSFKLSVVIGSLVLFDDFLSEVDFHRDLRKVFKIKVCIDTNQRMLFHLSSGNNELIVNIGNLIG